MNVIYSVKDYVTNVFDFQQANVSGAIDIVAVEHESGAVKCTPFHVHFGRGGELTSQADKTVTLVVNGEVVPDVHMKVLSSDHTLDICILRRETHYRGLFVCI
jgi:phosphatidate phosphatase LPIN